jgi:ligand-binding sensor domain-containing protein/AraC-like DNA-binding protein
MKLKLSSLLIIISFLFLKLEAGDRSLNLHHYASKQWHSISGLSHDNVTDVYRDDRGFVWVGTIEGLTRLAGDSTIIFSVQNHSELMNNRIVSIDGNQNGGIMVATAMGLSEVTKDNKVKKILEETDIKKIRVADDGTVFCLKENELVRVDSDGKINRLSVVNGLPEKSITDIVLFNDTLFLGSASGGLFSYSKGIFSNNLCSDNNDSVLSLAVDSGGKLMFVNKKNELFFFDGESCLKKNMPDKLSYDGEVKALVLKNEKIKLLYKDGVVLINGDNVSQYSQCCNLPGNLSSIFVDQQGYLWVGGSKGLSLYYSAPFKTLGKEDGLTSEMVYAMVEDKGGRIWVGTRGGGIQYYSDGKFKVVPEDSGVPSSFIGGMLLDKDGNIWAGTSLGVVKFKPVFPLKMKEVTDVDENRIKLVSVLFQDSKKRIWAGTAEGSIYMLVKNRFAKIREVRAGDNNFIAAITEDTQNNIWFATSSGILVLKDDSFSAVNMQSGLSDNLVLSLYSDKEGSIFAGTMRKGISIVNKEGAILNLGSEKGLCSDTIFSITEDNSANLWFTSTQGVFKISKKEVLNAARNDKDKIKCVPFDSQDGIKRPECTGGVQPVSMKRTNGEMWFPTVEGIAVRSIFPVETEKPHLAMDKIFVDGREINTDNIINAKESVSLFEVKFTASRFVHPESLKVQYILSPHESEWSDLSKQQRGLAVFQKIDPGKYVFKVKATDDSGSIEEISFDLIVKRGSVSLFVRYSFFGFLLFLFIWSAYRFFISANLKRRNDAHKDQKSSDKLDESDTGGTTSEDGKYEKSRLDDSVMAEYGNEIRDLMESEKLYTDSDLTLPALAKKLNLSTNIVSQVINSHFGHNFYTFVNNYRLEEVVEMMKESSFDEKSILEIAYMSGFKSKTTFNTVFKKYKGVTPSEYRKRVEKEKSDDK